MRDTDVDLHASIPGEPSHCAIFFNDVCGFNVWYTIASEYQGGNFEIKTLQIYDSQTTPEELMGRIKLPESASITIIEPTQPSVTFMFECYIPQGNGKNPWLYRIYTTETRLYAAIANASDPVISNLFLNRSVFKNKPTTTQITPCNNKQKKVLSISLLLFAKGFIMFNIKKSFAHLLTIPLISCFSLTLLAAEITQTTANEKVMSTRVKTLDDSNFENVIANGVVIVDCYADWCKPCQRFAPIFDEVAKEMSGSVVFGKLNVDNAPKVLQKYRISSNPTIILFKDGKELKRQVGTCDAAALKTLIQKAL